SCFGILRYAEKYSPEALERCCKDAVLAGRCNYSYICNTIRSSYGVESNVLHNSLSLSGYSFKFFLFVPILINSPPANCTGCFSAQGISISTTIPSSIGTSKNRKLILGESILEI